MAARAGYPGKRVRNRCRWHTGVTLSMRPNSVRSNDREAYLGRLSATDDRLIDDGLEALTDLIGVRGRTRGHEYCDGFSGGIDPENRAGGTVPSVFADVRRVGR